MRAHARVAVDRLRSLWLSACRRSGPAGRPAARWRSPARPACMFSRSKSPTPRPQREKGLMFRKKLPDGQGMLFDFKREQDVVVLDAEHLYSARHDLHPRRRTHPAHRREHRAAVDPAHPLGRAGAGGAGSDRGNRPQARHRARRPGGLIRSSDGTEGFAARLLACAGACIPAPNPSGRSAAR